jgi:hypothetical protein
MFFSKNRFLPIKNHFDTLSATGIKKPFDYQGFFFKADRTVSSNLTQTHLKLSKSSDIKELQLYFSCHNSPK